MAVLHSIYGSLTVETEKSTSSECKSNRGRACENF